MTIKKNLFIQVLNVLIIYITPLILSPFISRVFGPEGIGIQSYTTAIVTVFTLFSMMGISAYGTKELAAVREDRGKTNKLFSELLFLHFLVASFVFIFYIILILISGKYKIYYIIHLLTILGSLLDISFLYIAHEKFIYILVRNIIVQTITLTVTFSMVRSPKDLWIYVLVIAFGTFFTASTLWIHLKKYATITKVKLNDILSHFKTVLVYFVPSAAATLYSLLDKAIITNVTGNDAETGYYDRAYQILVVASFLIQALATVTAPRMSLLFAKNEMDEFKERINYSLRFLMFIALPCGFGILAVAPDFVPLFFGNGFLKTVHILSLLSPLCLILGISFYLDNLYIIPSGNRKKSAVIIIIGAVSNIILSILFVKFFASTGAALATIITELFVSVCLIAYSVKIIDIKNVLKSFFKYAVISAFMFILVRLLSNINVSQILLVFLEVGCGGLFYLLLLVITKDEFLPFIKSKEKG